MAQKAASPSLRIGFFTSWKSKWFGDKEYNYLLAQDLKIRDFLNDIFICSKLPTSEFLLKRKIGNLIYVNTNIYIPVDKRNQLLFFRKFFFFFRKFQQPLKLFFRKITYFFVQFAHRIFRFSKCSFFSWKKKQLLLLRYYYLLFFHRSKTYNTLYGFHMRTSRMWYNNFHGAFTLNVNYLKFYLYRIHSIFFNFFYFFPHWEQSLGRNKIRVSNLRPKKKKFQMYWKELSAKLNNSKQVSLFPLNSFKNSFYYESELKDTHYLYSRLKLIVARISSSKRALFRGRKPRFVSRPSFYGFFRIWFLFYRKIIYLIRFYTHRLSHLEKSSYEPIFLREYFLPFFQYSLSIRQYLLLTFQLRLRARFLKYFSLLSFKRPRTASSKFLAHYSQKTGSTSIIGRRIRNFKQKVNSGLLFVQGITLKWFFSSAFFYNSNFRYASFFNLILNSFSKKKSRKGIFLRKLQKCIIVMNNVVQSQVSFFYSAVQLILLYPRPHFLFSGFDRTGRHNFFFKGVELHNRVRKLKKHILFAGLHQLSLVIEGVLSKYIGGKFLFFPRYYIARRPRLRSAKLVSLYIKYQLEKGIPLFEVLRTVRQWCHKAMKRQYKRKVQSLRLFRRKLKKRKSFSNKLFGKFKRYRRRKLLNWGLYFKKIAKKRGRHVDRYARYLRFKLFKRLKYFRRKRKNKHRRKIIKFLGVNRLFFLRKMKLRRIGLPIHRKGRYFKKFLKSKKNLFYLRGVRMIFSGRINRRNMMAKTEWYRKGAVPTQYLKTTIDYFNCSAQTKLGSIGIKVWLYLLKRREIY
jgi:hypothetical protein